MSLIQGRITRELAFYTVFIALAGLTGLYIPVLYMAAILTVPVCLALLVRRLSLGWGIAVITASGLLLLPLAGLLSVISFLGQTALLGLTLGLLFKNHVGAEKGIAAAVCVAIAADLLVGLALPAAFGSNPLVYSEEQRQASIMMGERFFAGRGGVMSPADFAGLMEKNWPVFYTASLVFSSMLSAYFVYILTRLALIRAGYGVSRMFPFRRFKVPWYAIWGLIAGLAMMLAGGSTGGMVIAGKTVLLVSSFVFFLVGLSVLFFFMQGRGMSLPVRLLILLGIFLLFPYTAILLIGTGVLDALANLRRLTPDGELPKEDIK